MSAQPDQNFIYDNYSLFGQDTWKLTPNTTLTYGLRWDYNPTPHAGDASHGGTRSAAAPSEMTSTCINSREYRAKPRALIKDI